MNRRDFIDTVAGSLLGLSLPAVAQQHNKVFRIGFLRDGQPPNTFVAALEQGLRELGYVDEKSLVIEYRFADETSDSLLRLATQLVRLKVDIILASASPAAVAAQKLTSTMPIVFVGVTDPVAIGLVPSLAHPGGNVTGLANSAADLAGKRMQILKEVIPQITRVAVLWDPTNPSNVPQLKAAGAAADVLGVQLQPLPIRGPDDFEAALAAAQGAGGLLFLDDPMFTNYRART